MAVAQVRTVVCKVKTSGSDNVTNTVAGQRASCTSSAQAAAERLGGKLFSTFEVVAEATSSAHPGVVLFSLRGLPRPGAFK